VIGDFAVNDKRATVRLGYWKVVVVKHQREIFAIKVNDSSDDNDDDKKVPWSGVLSLSLSAQGPSRS
jgi:hypothetical protein